MSNEVQVRRENDANGKPVITYFVSHPLVTNHVDFWWNRDAKSWVVQTLDPQNNQIGDATYVGTKGEAESDAWDRLNDECRKQRGV